MFRLELLQAINDWQCGSSKKALLGEELKRLSEELDPRFKEVSLCCFRQISLDKAALWHLGTKLLLPEAISSWTLSIEVAETLKGGVPQPGDWQGIIFEIVPRPDQVVLNLDTLYRDPDFAAFYEEMRTKIIRFGDGIGRYGRSQHEVILEVDAIGLDSVYALGGYSSDLESTARLILEREPTDQELEELDQQMKRAGRKIGPAWVTYAAKDRVLAKLIEAAKVLKSKSGQP